MSADTRAQPVTLRECSATVSVSVHPALCPHLFIPCCSSFYPRFGLSLSWCRPSVHVSVASNPHSPTQYRLCSSSGVRILLRLRCRAISPRCPPPRPRPQITIDTICCAHRPMGYQLSISGAILRPSIGQAACLANCCAHGPDGLPVNYASSVGRRPSIREDRMWLSIIAICIFQENICTRVVLESGFNPSKDWSDEMQCLILNTWQYYPCRNTILVVANQSSTLL